MYLNQTEDTPGSKIRIDGDPGFLEWQSAVYLMHLELRRGHRGRRRREKAKQNRITGELTKSCARSRVVFQGVGTHRNSGQGWPKAKIIKLVLKKSQAWGGAHPP